MKYLKLNKLKLLLIKSGFHSTPSFLVIGAQKAGTTALHDILGTHPQITKAHRKEIHYFDNDNWYNDQNIHEYLQNFPLPFQFPFKNLCFESTPRYSYHPQAAKRIKKAFPNIKLIMIVREPSARAFSAWNMHHYHFDKHLYPHLHDARPFDVAIEEDLLQVHNLEYIKHEFGYVKRGIYSNQIERYLQLFPSKQLLVLESNEVRNLTVDTQEQICHFLGVEYHQLQLKTKNKSIQKNETDYTKTLAELKSFYAPHNKELFDLLGKTYDW